MNNKCMDVSSYQPDINWSKVKADGIENVILRCGFTGYGKSHTLNRDSAFEKHYKGAKEAGLHVGAYYYSGACSEADAEMEAVFVLGLLKDKQLDLPVYLDIEDNHDTANPRLYPQSHETVGKAVLTKTVAKFCDIMEQNGYFTGFYTAKSWTHSYLDMSVLSKYTFWLAHWTDKTDYSGVYGMWQYTDSGAVSGVTGNVDLNIMLVDFPAIIKKAGLNGFKAVSADTSASAEENASKALRMSVGLEAQDTAYDLDGDGKVTAADARLWLRNGNKTDMETVVRLATEALDLYSSTTRRVLNSFIGGGADNV